MVDPGSGLRIDGARSGTEDGLYIIASIDRASTHGDLLHVSVSYAHRDPSWADIRAVRDGFYPPDVDAMLVLPRTEDYVAGVPGWEDSHVFHLWQCPTVWGIG